MELIESLIKSSPEALTAMAITAILFAVRAFPNFKMHYVPLIALGLGAVIYPGLIEFTIRNVVLGIVVGAASVGFNQVGKQLFVKGGGEPAKGAGPWNVSVALLLLPALLLAGCATTGSGPVTDEAAQLREAQERAMLVRTSAHLGVFALLKDRPETRPWFETAVALLTVVVNEGRYEPEALKNQLQHLPVKELRSDEGYAVLTAALDAYQFYFGQKVAAQLDLNVYVRPVLVALRDGVQLGLRSRPPEPAAGVFPTTKIRKAQSPRGALMRD